MAIKRPLIFVSHITEEAQLAKIVRCFFEDLFPDSVDIFVSSDASILELGQLWFDKIAEALKTCAIQVALCSPASIKRPWIFFEVGACWMRGIPVIPLCHSGLDRGKLSMPLSSFQGASLSDKTDVREMIRVVSKCLHLVQRDVNQAKFIDDITSFEDEYTYSSHFGNAFSEALAYVGSSGAAAFVSGVDCRIGLEANHFEEFRRATVFFTQRGLVKIQRDSTMESAKETRYGVQLSFSEQYRTDVRTYLARSSPLVN